MSEVIQYNTLTRDNVLVMNVADLRRSLEARKGESTDLVVESLYFMMGSNCLRGLTEFIKHVPAESPNGSPLLALYIARGLVLMKTPGNIAVVITFIMSKLRHHVSDIAQALCELEDSEETIREIITTGISTRSFSENFMVAFARNCKFDFSGLVPATSITISMLCSALCNTNTLDVLVGLLRTDAMKVSNDDLFRERLMRAAFVSPSINLLEIAYMFDLAYNSYIFAIRSKKTTLAHINYIMYAMKIPLRESDKSYAMGLGNHRFLRMLDNYSMSNNECETDDFFE